MTHHIAVCVFGTRGDVGPLALLARRLLSRGHRVTFFTNPHFTAIASEIVGALSNSPEFHVVGCGEPWDPQSIVGKKEALNPTTVWTQYMVPQIRPFFSAIMDRHRGEPVDLVITHSWTYGPILAAVALDIPFGMVCLQAVAWFSASLPPRVDKVPWPEWIRRPLMRHVVPAMIRRFFDPPLRNVAQELGVPPDALGTHMFQNASTKASFHLGLWDPSVRPPQDDDPPNAHIVGFPIDDVEPALDDALGEFCQTRRPWVMGLGSALPLHFQAPYQLMAQALLKETTPTPAVFVGASPEAVGPVPEHIRIVPYASYAALFPLARGVVHHGGAGSTALALYAGVPQGVLAFGNDMFDHGERIETLGLGTLANGERLGVSHLTKMLHALSRDAVQQRARAFKASLVPKGEWDEAAAHIVERALT